MESDFAGTYGKKDIQLIGPKIFKRIPNEVKMINSIDLFKKRLKQKLLNQNLINIFLNNNIHDIIENI